MFSITEQFSAATKSQLEAQLNLINNFASKAVESAEKVIALNLSTTKATVEKSSSAAQQLLSAKDGQEFFRLSASQTPSLDHLLAYGRQLFTIASDAQAILLQSAREQIKDAKPVLLLAALSETVVVPAAKAEAKTEAKAEVKTVAEVKAAPVLEAKPVAKVEAKVEAKAIAEPKLEDNLDEEEDEDEYEEVQPEVVAKPVVAAAPKPAAPAVADAKPAAPAKSAAKPASTKK
ncbi:phasin family protein [Rugamonas sp. DEMB1]|uniref:phasin family protein n=1 Tax=Rugamonas sp. DEMB1 TaxID=3039386 RepID=UPI00244880C9|nr:phasin family protein [Rugamonas sp. DEMB1]WGG51491.1 phasin family protein [Rugamonas sp. DEMB1]